MRSPAKLAEPRVTEAAFTRQVIAFARLFAWQVAHFRPALTRAGKWRTAVQGDGAGFPDLVLVRRQKGDRRVIVAELKVGRNRPTPEQAAWLAAFEAAGVPAYLWRPDDWPEVEAVLTAPTPAAPPAAGRPSRRSGGRRLLRGG